MENLVAATIFKMIQYFAPDTKRINHALKVHNLAQTIARLEKLPPAELLILETAAVLHDIGIKAAEKQYHSSAGTYQELLGPPVARELLAEFDPDSSFLNRVLFLIGNHHSYRKIDGLDFQILVEADFLVNIAEDNLTQDQIAVIKTKYFKTLTGNQLLTMMFNGG